MITIEKRKPLHIYIDESGDLGKKGSKCFVIACLSTKKPELIGRIIKKIRQRKLKKSLKKVPELKGNKSTKTIREAALKKISNSNCNIDIILIYKDQIKDSQFEKTDKLYNYLIEQLFDNVDISNTKKINIIIDKKDTNKILRNDFDKCISKKINERKFNIELTIKHKNSQSDKCLQVIDFVAWAAHRKYSFEDDSYFKIIENKVISTKKYQK